MRIVKLERPGRYGEGILDGDTVHLLGGWREGGAEDGAFSLPRWRSSACSGSPVVAEA